MRAVFFILSILLLILAACEPTLRTIPTSELQNTNTEQIESNSQTDPCENILCLSGQFCNQGKCEKIEPEVETVELEIPTVCAFGEVFEGEECTCEEGRYWCGEQQRCIPNGDCCVHTQCDRFERCVPTQLRVRLCADLPTGKLCRLLSDNGRKELAVINSIDMRLGVANWFNNESINFTLNNDSLLLSRNQKAELMGSIFHYETFEEYGGFCKLDED